MLVESSLINGRYALRAPIASGATAQVYLAEDVRLGRQVAIKILSAEQARQRHGIERFRHEAQAAAALSHPNIVAVYDWGLADDTAFLVMQHVEGSNLRQLLRDRGRLSENAAARLGAEIAAGLDVAHRHGIVHRDVKPRNVLVDQHGRALLTDFGIAAPSAQSGDDTDSGVYGTALYVAPEQAQGLAVDGRADVYALGALLYEAVCGRPPFRGTTAAEVARQHVSAPLVRPRDVQPDVSPAMDSLLVRALAKDPRDRFASAAEMRQALLAIAERPIAAIAERPAAGAEHARRGPRLGQPGRWLKWLAPVLVLAVLAIIAVPSLATARQAHVPDIAGRTTPVAEAAIREAGLTLTTEEATTQDTPAGVIVTQRPLPGDRADAGSAVHALVSRGIEVPDLTGQQCTSARSALEANGWTVKPVRWRVANAPDFGKVVAQDPAPGSVVKDKGQISVQVAGPVRPC